MNMEEHDQDGEAREAAREEEDQVDDAADTESDGASSPSETGEEAGGQSFTEEAEDALDDLPGWAAEKLESFEDEDVQPEATERAIDVEADTAEDVPPEQPEPRESEDAESDIPQQDMAAKGAPNLDMMLDLPLDVNVELGRAELPLAQVLELQAGSVIQLDRLPGEPLDLYVNDQLVAKGEIVVLNETFAFRITDLVDN